MAELQIDTQTPNMNFDQVREVLSTLGIELNQWPLVQDPQILSLLAKTALTDEEKEQVLLGFESRFIDQKNLYGYQSRDLVVLHPNTPNLDSLLSQFDRVHLHTDDEVRYIIDGSGIFGFLTPTNQRLKLTVRAGEYIRVPKNTRHWFVLDDKRRIKAVRYFTNKDGWVAHYTGDSI